MVYVENMHEVLNQTTIVIDFTFNANKLMQHPEAWVIILAINLSIYSTNIKKKLIWEQYKGTLLLEHGLHRYHKNKNRKDRI